MTGTGATNRNYGQNAPETNDIRDSKGAQAVRDAYIANGCRDKEGIAYGTEQAFLDTYRDPLSTAFQVGGFAGASASDVGNGMIEITIPNEAGANSFFYHLVPNTHWSHGPFRTIHQTFQWTEPEPAACEGGSKK